MATLGTSSLGLIDMMRAGGNEANAEIAEVLNRLSPVQRNGMYVECNSGTAHKHTIRTGLPSVTWGKLYQGIPQSKSARMMVQDTTGFVEGLSQVDERLLQISKNGAAVRLAEGEGFLEAMSQEIETGFFYHDTGLTPEKFKGVAARYNVLGGSGAGNQVVNGAGTGSDNTSVWFITWSEKATHFIYPEGVSGGIDREDMGRQRVTDANGDPYFVKEELFRRHVGVAVRDWRYNARIANIDVSDLIAGTTDLYKLMRAAFYKLQGVYATALRDGSGKLNPNASAEGRTVIYMNRTVMEALDAQQTSASLNAALRLGTMELEGRVVPTYRGIPIEVTDAILNTETKVA
jgi:hypothetical protein